jgi:hypothetical protein
MSTRVALGLIAALTLLSLTKPAQAIPSFQKELLKLYAEDKESQFAQLAASAKCFICHQGKNRHHRNPYGQQLDPLLDKKTDKKDPDKIIAALKQVAEMHSVAGDDSSPTFGELIAQGKLPGGTLKECKQEPTGEVADTEGEDHDISEGHDELD